jgi:immune inhibitor A
MKNKRITILCVLMLSLLAFPLSIFASTAGTTTVEKTFPDYVGVDWKSGLAGNVKMPEFDDTAVPKVKGQGAKYHINSYTPPAPPPGDGWVYDWYLNASSGGLYPYMQLRASVGNVDVYVAQDEMLQFQPGDSRNDDPLNWQVTDDMVEYIAAEFNAVIYPTDTGTYGAPFDRDGTNTIFEQLSPYYPLWEPYVWDWIATDNPQRVILKIFNLFDQNYDDPDYPYYVVGFFSSTYTGYYNRNMIHIDNWRYWQRLGPEGHQWYPITHPELEVTRPNTYESTVAHEFQHNIHHDWQPNGELWMNEGCSMLAEPLCGYEYPFGYLPYFLATPDNSLTEWGDQGDDNILADYAQVLLWTTYIADHYGVGVLSEYVQSGIPGIPGINAAFAAEGYSVTMDDVFNDWRIANLIHSDSPGGGKYNYFSIDLGAFLEGEFVDPIPRVYEVEGEQVPWTCGASFGGTKIYDWYVSDQVLLGTYGTDYISLVDLSLINFIVFKGADYATVPGWSYHSVDAGGYWYSGAADLLNTLIATEVYVDPDEPTLTIDTYWDIEDYWDFGFVQISTDGGEWDSTWTSLGNEYTTYDHDPGAHPDVVSNLPGLTGWTNYYTTDPSIVMTFDLSAYAGQTIHIGFRYVTDWAFTYEGWFLFDAVVGTTDILSSLERVSPAVDWLVTVVEKKTYPSGYTKYTVDDMFLWGNNWGVDISWISNYEDAILVVSPIMEKGLADYCFKSWKLGCGFFR